MKNIKIFYKELMKKNYKKYALQKNKLLKKKIHINDDQKKYKKELSSFLRKYNFYRIIESEEAELSVLYKHLPFYGNPYIPELIELEVAPHNEDSFPTMSIEEYHQKARENKIPKRTLDAEKSKEKIYKL